MTYRQAVSDLRRGTTQQAGCDGVTRMHEIVHAYRAIARYMQPLGTGS